jgi:hypothetical protein
LCDITVFFFSILWCSQSGDDLQEEDLAKSGYKLSMKVKLLKHWSIFLATKFNMYRNLAIFLFFFFELWPLKIQKGTWFLAHYILYIAF